MLAKPYGRYPSIEATINIKLGHACIINKAYVIDIQAKLFTILGLALSTNQDSYLIGRL